MAEPGKDIELKSRRLSVMAQIKEVGGSQGLGGLGDAALDSGSSGRRQRPISMSIAALPDSLKDQIRSQAYGKKLSVPSIPASGMKSSISASSIPSAAAQQPPLSPSSSSEKLANISIVLGEPKGKEATIIISPSATVQEALNESNQQLGIKSFDKMVGFLKESNVYMQSTRTLSSYLVRPNEKITITKFSKDKKTFYLTVQLPDNNEKEIIECSPDHTVWGVIQMLTKRVSNAANETFAMWKDGQKLPPQSKLSAVGIKGAVPVEVKKCAADPAEASPSGDLKVKKSSTKESSSSSSKKEKKVAPSASASSVIISNPEIVTREQKTSALSNFLLNRPSKDDLVKKNIISKVEADAATAGVTPLKLEIFQQLCTFLENHLELQGIFRISGGLQDVRSLYLQFRTSGPLDLSTAEMDPHTATGALKLYLREQKDPLIPFNVYNDFLKAQKQRDPAVQKDAIKAAICKLPEPNLSILKHLMAFLKKVSSRADVNLMSPNNLGIVFGPTIMWDPDTTSLNFENTNIQSALVVSIINHYDYLFDGQSPTPVPESPAAPSASPKKSALFSALSGVPKRSASASVAPRRSAPMTEEVQLRPVARNPSPSKLRPVQPSPSQEQLVITPPAVEIAAPPPPAPSFVPTPPVASEAETEDAEEGEEQVSIESLYAALVDPANERRAIRSVAKKILKQESEFISHSSKQSPRDLTNIIVMLMKHLTKQ